MELIEGAHWFWFQDAHTCWLPW